MSSLKDLKDLHEIFIIIDLIASEYGWTIEYIQSLSVPELSCLLRCILKRHGAKEEDLPAVDPKQQEADNLIKLARQLNAKPDQIQALKEGRKVEL